MPIISVTMGKSDEEQKTDLIKKLTSAAVDATTLPEHAFTVLIHELDDYSIGLGGKTLAEVKKTQ